MTTKAEIEPVQPKQKTKSNAKALWKGHENEAEEARVKLAAALLILASVPLAAGYAEMGAILDRMKAYRNACGGCLDDKTMTKLIALLTETGLIR